MKEGWLVRLAVLASLLALCVWSSVATAQTPPDLQNWTLRIEASATGVTADTDNVLGVAPTAVDGWQAGEDVLDTFPVPGTFVHLSFYHASSEPGWANHGGYYRTDLRAPLLIAEQKVWSARLRANLGTTASPVPFTLRWGNLSALPAELGFSIQQVTATGEPIGDPVDMRAQDSLTGQFATNGTVETRIYNIVVTDLRVGEPVVLSGVTVAGVTANSVTLEFTTDPGAIATVLYGPTTAYGSTVTETALATVHRVEVAGLAPSTEYHFKVRAVSPGRAASESPDITASTLGLLTISGLQATGVTSTAATVTWTTNVAADATLRYGTDPANLGAPLSVPEATTEHSIALAGLTPNTLYTVQVVSAAAGYAPAQATFTFRTLPAINITAGPTVANVTGTSAVVSWTTDVASSSVVQYGLAGATDQTAGDPAASETAHSVTLTGLTAGATYSFRVVSSAAGYDSAVSAVATFSTLAPIVLVSGPTVAPGSTTAVITWTTNVACIGQVEVGPTTDYGITASEETATTDHSVTVTGLQKDTEYHFRIRASAEGFTPLVGEDGTFRTLAIGFAVSPEVTNLTSTTAVITFKALVDSTAVVDYGTTDQYGLKVEVTEPATDFSVELKNLEPGTVYHYRVTITAGLDSVATSDAMFATLRKVAFTFRPRVTELTRTSAVIAFVTDVAAIGEVQYGPTTAYGLVKSDTAPVVQHRIALTGLTPGTEYHFNVRVTAEGRDENATGDMVFTTLPLVVAGDIDGDGVVTEADALLALKFAVGLIELTESQIRAADVAPRGRPDGRITAADAVRLLRVAAGLELIHDQGGGGSF